MSYNTSIFNNHCYYLQLHSEIFNGIGGDHLVLSKILVDEQR